MVHLLICNLL